MTIRLQFAIECLRRSNQQGMGHFGAKFMEEWVDSFKPNFNTIYERYAESVVGLCKRNRVDIFCRLSTMHERDRQTDRPRNGNISDVA